MCLTVGMIGGPYVKGMVGKVKKTPVRSVTFHANLERIAVINLDTGIEKKGEQIYYAAKLIEYPDESYQTTSLEEAKDGMKKDLYGAYIIIPSTFSTAVDSINGTPQKAVFEYQINPHLEGQDRDNMIYELTAFQDSIRNNVSYVFLDAILKEVHNVQDGSMTILANDDSERENLSGVSAEELIQTVEFTELKENNEVISPIDLSKESEGLENTAKSIGEQFDNALDNGQQDYDKITDDQDSMLTALENLKTGVSKVNPLVDEKGKSTIENGIASVNNEIDESNKKVEGQRSLLEQSMVEEINSYGKKQTDGKLKTSRDNIENSVKENVFDAVNKKVDSSLKEQNIQNRQQVQKILEEYTLDLQRYLDQTVQGEIKASVKEITKENVEKTQKALNSKHASETEQLKQSYEKKLEEQRVSLEGQKALLEEQKNALEEQKTLLEEQKNSLEEQKNTLEVKIAEFKENQKQQNERFKQAAEAIRGAAEEEYNDQIQALLAQIDELKTEEENPEEPNPTEPENPEEPDPTEPENPEEPKPTEPENPGETETTETENPETLSLAETEENVPMPNGDNLAFSVIYTTQQMANLPDSIGTVMEVLDSKKGQLVLNEKKFLNKNLELYRVGNVSLEWMARNLSVLQHEQGIVSKIPENITFYEMYGIQQARELNAEQRWKKSQSHKSLAVPLGVRGNDEYVYLNLHEKAHGPHGLVAGTTGSGKSEIIQSYILSLAVNFHPYEVGFLLIDYKGGGMAGLFKNLPHLLGTITNLDGAESLRAMASIKSELKRRQRIFSEYGVNHINGYNKLFKSGEASVPIPHLFLISDEFAELKKEQPDFMAELISTARIGRSLGVHLILATQKPSGVVDDQIWSNSKFKLALKVQDEADSREILKTADAAFITQPGRAYLQVGNNEIYELFQSAWSGATVEAGGMSEQIDDRVYKINELGQGELLNENLDDESESGEKRTQLEAVVDYIEEIFEEQHCEKVPKPWLPSLPFKMISTIQEIKAMEKLDLSFPLGMVDIPDQQSQEEFWIDLETEGNFGFFSAAGYGKSTVLTNCILSLARKNRVSELNFYIFDFGNSALIPLKKLAHTADYMTYDDEEKRGKFFRLIQKEMKVRKQKFAQVSAQSFSVYNQLTDKPLKAIVIVVDNMDILRELDSDEEEEFTKIARDGAGLGIYLMFSALSENGVRYGTLNNIKVKVAGYMYDAADISGIVGRGEYKLPDKKGRAMVNYKGINIMQLYTAVPFENEIDYIEQIQSVVEQINVYYPQEKAQSIPILPETLTYSMLENYETADDTKADIILGLDVEEVKKEGILQMHSPFAVIGDNQRGKTNVMKCILNQLDDQASIYVFDSQSRELNSYREYGGITFIQSEEEVSGFVDEMTYLGESRKEEFMQALTENPEMTVSEFASKQQPVYVVVDQADTFTDMLNEEYEDEITEILERAVNMGVMMIFGIHASKFRGYDELTSWIKSTNHGLVLGDQGNAEIFPVPYQEKIEFTKGLLFRNGVSTKIMIPKC